MNQHFMLRLVYTLFLALLVSLFIGLGIEAFYPSPKAPEYPESLNRPIPTIVDSSKVPAPVQETAEEKAARDQFEKDSKAYREKSQIHNRNVSAIALIAAIIVLAISLTFMHKIEIISDGLLLGGVFTIIYSLIRGFDSDSPTFRFTIVTVGLLLALLLGYLKFIKPENKKPD